MKNKKDNYYFLNLDLPENKTGIENASLLRCRIFEKELGITPNIITAKYNPRLDIQRRKMIKNCTISKDVQVLNLYEYYQGNDFDTEESKIKLVKKNKKWTYQNIEGTYNYRVYNENGQKIIYHACDSEGRLMYNNIFHKDKKVRREYFNSNGALSKVQLLDKNSNKTIFETYYTVQGKACIFKHINEKNQQAEYIQLVDANGDIYASFDKEEQFIEYWLKSILKDEEEHYLIIDKQRVYYPFLKNWNANNIYRISCIHSTHIKNGKNYMEGKINRNYKSLFEDLSKPEAIVVLTEKQKEHIEQRFGVTHSLYTIPHPMEEYPDKIEMKEREINSAVYVARFAENKQHKSAVRVFKQVVDEIPNAKLHFYGTGKNKTEIKKVVKDLNLENDIFFHGYVTNIKNIYNNAQLAISTSSFEGFSLFILESITYGCPVVSYDINYGPNDLIDQGANGDLVEYNDEDGMAQKIINSFKNRELLQQKSERAYRKSKQFSSQAFARQWKILIDEITEKRSKY